MSRTKNTVRNIIWGLVNKAVMLLMPFVIRTIIINQLGAEYLGLNSLFKSILHILNLTELGFGSAVVYSLYKPVADGDKDFVCSLMKFYRKVYSIIGWIIFAAGLIVMPFTKYLIKGDVPQDVNLYILYIIFLLNTVFSYWLFAYKGALLSAHQRNDISSNITTIGFLFQYIFQIVVLYLVQNYYFYIIFTLVFTIVRNIAIAVIVDKKYPEYMPKGDLPQNEILSIKKKVFGLMTQKICAASRNSLDSIVISSFMGLIAVTQHDNYYYIVYALHGVLDIILVSSRSSIGNSIVKEKQEKNYHDFRLFDFMYEWLSGCCCIVMLCTYQDFMGVWVGEDLVLPMRTMLFYCIYFYVWTMIDVRTLYDDASGIWWETKWLVIVETIMNVSLNIIFAILWGIKGVILATITSLLIMNFWKKSKYLFKVYFTEYKVSRYWIEHFIHFIITIIIGLISFLICKNIMISGIGGFFIKGIIAFALVNLVYLLCFIKTPYYSDMKKLIKRILHRKIRK